MDSDALLKLIAGYGLGGFLAYVLGRIMLKIGERMIAAIDRLVATVGDHTKKDLEHHADVREAVVRVESKLDAVLDERDRTPVEGIPQSRHRTAPRGVPAGYYGPRRGSTRDDDGDH